MLCITNFHTTHPLISSMLHRIRNVNLGMLLLLLLLVGAAESSMSLSVALLTSSSLLDSINGPPRW
jgi:hypothetical protein